MTGTRPSLLESLGTVAAASARRDPWTWAAALAVLVSTAWWAPTSAAVAWCAVAATIVLRVPWLPRGALRAIPATCIVLLLTAALGLTRGGSEGERSIGMLLAAGQALALVWAVAAAHGLRRKPTADDAEAASAHAAVWAQTHPWRVAIAVTALVGPLGSLWIDAWQAAWEASQADGGGGGGLRRWIVPEWFSPGATLLVAAALGRRSALRAAEFALVAAAVTGVVWAAASRLWERTFFRDEALEFLLVLGGLNVLLLLLSVGAQRFPVGIRAAPVRVVAAVAAGLAVAVGTAWLVRDESGRPEDVGTWAVEVVRHATLLALLAAAAASTLRGRDIVLLSVAFGMAVPCGVAIVSERFEPLGLAVAGGAIACLNQAVFVLAVRRVRSLTVVPPDHPLRTDWGVDLSER